MSSEDLKSEVRDRYAKAAKAVASGSDPIALVDADQCAGPAASSNESCCSGGAAVNAAFGSTLYEADQHGELPADALAASLGCGNPTSVADLNTGEKVLDLGCGGGIDVLLSARRVGEAGFVYGVDMTDEMLELARANADKAGATNVEFLRGTIEQVPLPDESVDVVISNCVINLSTDKAAGMREMFRVLVPGGRVGVSDIVAEDHLTTEQRGERGSYVGCIAGALSVSEYVNGLSDAGFTDVEVKLTHAAAPEIHSAIVRASKPVITQ